METVNESSAGLNDPFELLPDEYIIEIALYKTIEYITRMCQASRRFNNVICNDEYFWKQKFIYDFGNPPIGVNIISWKEAYENYGTVVGFGSNENGQLGLGNIRNTSVPLRILAGFELYGIRAKSVSCGALHTMIINVSGNVWAFGSNQYNQLGLGDRQDKHIPTKIPDVDALAICCGINYSVFMDENYRVYRTNNSLQSGSIRNDVFISVSAHGAYAETISCGGYHIMIIDVADEVWGYGNNDYGQLGLGNQISPFSLTHIPNIEAKAISCGAFHTMIIDLDNNVWAFGRNNDGQLGLDDQLSRFVPTQVLSSDGQNLKAKSVSCGESYTMIIDMNDNVWAFGYNNNGQLGLGNQMIHFSPTQVLPITGQNLKAKAISCGKSHTILIDLNNNVWAFGGNDMGQLGLGDTQDRHVPTQIPNINAQSVSCGYKHTIIVIYPYHQFESNVHLISFEEAARKLNAGEFSQFNFFSGYQVIPHNPVNYIATFFGNDGNIYLTELQYNQVTNRIFSPV